MKFTGERVVEGDGPRALYDEHLRRYELAAASVSNTRVIDVGCGTGYGARYLVEQGASEVFALDVSEEAVDYARRRYDRQRIHFLVGSGLAIPVESHSFERVICFETIEHVSSPERLVDELQRVVLLNGSVIISTPNRRCVSPGNGFHNKPLNQFHVREFDQRDLLTLLSERFRSVELRGQSFFPAPLVWPLLREFPSLRRLERCSRRISRLSRWWEPRTLIATCSAPR